MSAVGCDDAPEASARTSQRTKQRAMGALFVCSSAAFSSAVSGEVVPCSCFRHGNMRRGGHKRRFHLTLPLRPPRDTLARMASAAVRLALELSEASAASLAEEHTQEVQAAVSAGVSVLRHLTPLVRPLSAAKTLRTEVAASPCLSIITCLLNDVSSPFEDSAVVQCAFLVETLHLNIARPSAVQASFKCEGVHVRTCGRVDSDALWCTCFASSCGAHGWFGSRALLARRLPSNSAVVPTRLFRC